MHKYTEIFLGAILIPISFILFIGGIGLIKEEIKNFEPLPKSKGITLYENVENNHCTEKIPKFVFWHVITKKTRPHHITFDNVL